VICTIVWQKMKCVDFVFTAGGAVVVHAMFCSDVLFLVAVCPFWMRMYRFLASVFVYILESVGDAMLEFHFAVFFASGLK